MVGGEPQHCVSGGHVLMLGGRCRPLLEVVHDLSPVFAAVPQDSAKVEVEAGVPLQHPPPPHELVELIVGGFIIRAQ